MLWCQCGFPGCRRCALVTRTASSTRCGPAHPRADSSNVAERSGVPVPRGGPPPILKPYRRRRLRPGASPGGPPGPAYTRAAAGLGHALYSMVLVSGRPLRVDVRTCQNSSIFSILQCFTPVALFSHNSAQPDTSFVHFDP